MNSTSVNEPAYLLLSGFWKSATSSLVGLMNSHPKCLILYESNLSSIVFDKYSKKLLSNPAIASAADCWRDSSDTRENFRLLSQWCKKNHRLQYKVIGTKFPIPDEASFQRHSAWKLVYINRSLKEWLAKIEDNFIPSETDCRRAIYLHLKSMINARMFSDHCFVDYDTFMTDNEKTIRKIFEFANLDVSENNVHWWKTVGNYPDDIMKASQNWWGGHLSSKLAPGLSDTSYEINEHFLWDFCDPFIACYGKSFDREKPSIKQMKQDIKELAKVFDFDPVSKSELYKHRETSSLALRPGKKLKVFRDKLLKRV